tara:strand:+ start:2005 stop:2478 length:474 start_codon:yes stop_codon:yes gene_type:complete
MALAVGTNYQNVFYDYVLDSIRDVLISEFDYGKIYIAPNILHKDPFQIRIWGLSQEETDNLANSEWQKLYSIEIVLGAISQNPNEQFYKQFYQDSERIYQSLWNNFKGSYSKTVGSRTIYFMDGNIEEIVYEIDEDDEIEGLHKATIGFNILANRED